MMRWGKWEIPEKTHRPVASSGTIPAWENAKATPPGIETGLPWWDVSSLTTTPPCHQSAEPGLITELNASAFFPPGAPLSTPPEAVCTKLRCEGKSANGTRYGEPTSQHFCHHDAGVERQGAAETVDSRKWRGKVCRRYVIGDEVLSGEREQASAARKPPSAWVSFRNSFEKSDLCFLLPAQRRGDGRQSPDNAVLETQCFPLCTRALNCVTVCLKYKFFHETDFRPWRSKSRFSRYPVPVALWRAHRNLTALNLDIWVDTQHFLGGPSTYQQMFHPGATVLPGGNVAASRPARKSNRHLRRVDGQLAECFPALLKFANNGPPTSPLADIPHHAVDPGIFTAYTTTMWRFPSAQYTQLWRLTMPLNVKVASSIQTITYLLATGYICDTAIEVSVTVTTRILGSRSRVCDTFFACHSSFQLSVTCHSATVSRTFYWSLRVYPEMATEYF
ncbi:hypothetical protein PR048_010078 [Dryococelus australis]|uniref:Uncharacterized protein n=1 Tax=Dryococelus australis TaxID=614101 RepID=A0ABQ9I1S4_9NEOP|nr:hypothetical protein PR048_010078 [Dryococelus australis]